MATVCRALAAEVNKDAAPQDKVNAEQLRGRVRVRELGREKLGHSDPAKNEHEEPEQEEQPEMQPAAAITTTTPGTVSYHYIISYRVTV
ncbi:hypothetical protein [Desulfocastanea catecholica]